ncbi:IS630 family transposase [Paenibacillus sp. J5C_2022]|uniref:IS630 family transposase n=1 Tax=Paenibacillus sp. J5C2022 TaxID=2977129 RepID=UPI0021D1B00F|nr:IS630 family transposase [Paenibacillus sp. J5C2022]MCU6713274.1 IS630 family transposase [Paenibacillus sp. J5C2022]
MKAAIKENNDLRMHERYQTILLDLHGVSKKDISKIIGRSLSTVYNYINAYRQEGIQGLKIGTPPGRQPFLSAEQEQRVYQTIVNQTPEDVGFPAKMNWTSPIIRKWIERDFGVSYSDRGTRELLYRLKLSFTVPTYTLTKADPTKQEAFVQKSSKPIKKLLNGEIDRILFIDESMIRDYQALSRTWFPKGKQKIVPTYGKHHGAKLIGSLDYETGEVFCTQEIQYTAQEFLSFLQKLVKKYENQKIVLVLDNAKIHHAALIQPFLTEHQSVLTLLYLPPYSPKLNLIEGLWGWLKESVINNVFFDSVQKIRKAVQGFIREINKTPKVTVDRLCVQL